jgi:uncharacterized protein Yka (UPF0111/DUF47 family)
MRNIIGMFAKSPFGPLEEHIHKVMQCSELFTECVKAYCSGDFPEAEKLAIDVNKMEHEAGFS